MKKYKWADIRRIAKEQGYKLAALENLNGEKIISFNQIKVPIDKHLTTLETRLKSEIHPDGVYNVLLAHSISKSRTPDRYPLVKGNLNDDQLHEIEKRVLPLTPTIVEHAPERVLTWENALQMQQTIATLNGQVSQLQFENNQLQMQVEELISELSSLEEAQKPNDTVSFLKETVPTFVPIIERWFDLEEKKLGINAAQVQARPSQQATAKKPLSFAPGSANHLTYIEYLYRKGLEDKMNAELDKLEAANPELYAAVCEKLGITEEEGGGNE